MRRRLSLQPEASPKDPPPVHIIDPNGIYFVDQAQALLRLTESTLGREIRERRLRVSRRAGRYFFLGKWLLEWIEAGELRPDEDRPLNGDAEAAAPGSANDAEVKTSNAG
jgi:hypothetical protein